MKELLEICAALEQLGDEPCGLATVVDVEGSAYRRAGARMLLNRDGDSWGMVSGGCLESDVIQQVRRSLESGQSRVFRYDSTSKEDIVFGTGLGCNGIVSVLVEPVTPALKESLLSAVRSCEQTRNLAGLATAWEDRKNSGGSNAHASYTAGFWSGSEDLAHSLNLGALEPTATGVAKNSGQSVFIQRLLPRVHLIIFGGWLDVVPVIHMAKEVGFKVTVVDPRGRPSSRRLFHKADSVLLCSAEDALSHIIVDERTVAVTMNHHFETDQKTVCELSQMPVKYVGALGPKRRLEKIVHGLKEAETFLPDEFMQSLHGPAGLDLGAKTPEEIALSIMSEILSVLNRRNPEPIRDLQSVAPIPA